MPEIKKTIRVVIHQTAPLLGEIGANEGDMRRRVVSSAGADLLVFPELALTGYSLRTRAQALAVPMDGPPPLTLPVDTPPLAYGTVERGRDQLVYNTALVQHGSRILGKHRKVYLPTYGIFDEARYFARGRKIPPVIELPSGWRVGLLVCEDFWHPGLLYLVAMQGADAILVLSAAPGRGEPADTRERMNEDSLFSSPETWSMLARTAAVQYGVYLVLANRSGVEEGLTFAGGSLVAAPSGEILVRAPQGEAASLEVQFSVNSLRRARTPFAHLRDEDPLFMARGLEMLMEEGG